MSKDKPEVGDVWRSSTCKMFIVRITKKGFVHCVSTDIGGFHTSRTELDFIQKYCIYLGKSKVNIEDLFKTENE